MASERAKYFTNDHYIPTLEDVLDINFHSIVSDGRAILSGTLTPRPWSDISSTWDEDGKVKVRKTHRSAAAKKNMSAAARVAWQKRIGINRRARHGDGRAPKGYISLVRILTANGMNVYDAKLKARELLGGV